MSFIIYMLNSITYNLNNNKAIYQPKFSIPIIKPNSSSDTFFKTTKKLSFNGNFAKNITTKISEFFKKPFRTPEEIIISFDNFGIKEYNTLSERDKSSLKKYWPFEAQDVKNTLFLYKTMKANLVKKFPKGFTFVSVGRSPSVLAKTLESEGFDVKYCPISGINNDIFFNKLPKDYIKNYAKYLESIGITKQTVNKANKPFIFVDYTFSGKSLKNFEELLAKDEIDVKGSNVIFLSLNKDLLNSIKEKKINTLISDYFCAPRCKNYSPVKKANQHDVTSGDIMNTKMSYAAKLMQFHLLYKLKK